MKQTSQGMALRLAAAALVMWASASPLLAQSGNSRLTGLKLSGDKPIQIESDRLEVRENENIAVFSGNVNVVQGLTLLKSGKMTVHYSNDGGSAATGSSNIERLVVDGKVYVKSENQVATGDRGTFDMKSEVLVLSGRQVVLSEGDNVAVGCKLTVQMKTGKAQLESCKGETGQGRIKILITPKTVRQ